MMIRASGLVMGVGAMADSGGSSEVAGLSAVAEGGMEEGERSGGGGGNRWPRQETLALLKIRSDMDVTFRDASLKGPLWEQVSRKMAELGFQRSAKKCKEKFENVYKYHKRTKDGRASKPDGKTYRFFDQLAALENSPQPPPANADITPMTPHVTGPSTSPTPLSVAPPRIFTNNPISTSSFQPSQPSLIPPITPQNRNFQPPLNSTSSSTSSDEGIQRRHGRKRKWKDYFERLMKDVVQKQEELQKKFLEALEKRESDRIAREEAWRVQETAKINREHDRLVNERSVAASRSAAVIAFLQKVTAEHGLQIPTNSNATPRVPMQVQATENPPPATTTPTKITEETSNRDSGGGGDDQISTGSSRWPKAEVEALIKLRTGLELEYQDNGAKGPLWEEISKSMAKLGYNRNAKRCKEKWENINKYFKKVKESNKNRSEDSKTCPYFHQLDAIYKEKAKNHVPSFNLGYAMKPGSPMAPNMARPEQQLPQINPALYELENGNDSEKNDHEDDYEDEDKVVDYEMIANKQPSSLANTVE